MKVVYELKSLFLNHGIDISELWTTPPSATGSAQPSLIGQFVAAVWAQDGLDEESLSKHLYGCPSHSPSAKFRKLKERVIDVLSGYVLDLDRKAQSLNQEQRNYYAAHRELVIGKILEGRGAKLAARYFYLRSARRAGAYDLNFIGVAANQALRYYASRFERDPKKFNQFHDRYIGASRRMAAEHEATEYYSRVVLAYGTSPKAQEKVRHLAQSFVQVLDAQFDVKEMGPSYAHAYYLLRLAGIGPSVGYAELLPVVTEAVVYFERHRTRFATALTSFLLSEFVIRTVAYQIEKASAVLERLKKLVSRGSTQWLKLQELTVQYYFYTKDFSNARKTYLSAARLMATNPVTCSPQLKERWQTLRIYLHLLHAADPTIPAPPQDPLGLRFKPQKAINNILNLDKEKSGRNIPLLFAELLFHLFTRNIEKLEQRLDGSRQYMQRYGRDAAHYRSNGFFKILLRLPQSNYRADAFQQRTARHLKNLKDHPLISVGQSFEIEVLPYEVLYRYIVAFLQRNRL